MRGNRIAAMAMTLAGSVSCIALPLRAQPPRNIVIFVADGLRAGSVNSRDAPTLDGLRARGVSFVDSHALFPTFTTPNAAAIATGHYLGDTGDYSNALYPGYQPFDGGNFGHASAGAIPFVENDAVLGDLDDHFEGNYLGEDTLLGLARLPAHRYGTAAIGKLGPVAIQDVAQLAPVQRTFPVPQTILIDDATGAEAPPLAADVSAALQRAGLPPAPPARQQPAGDSHTPGTLQANVGQQQYFIAATTRAVLPLLRRRGRPFILVYWSRDPDGTQHNQGDSLNALSPGINGPTSRAGVRNADDNLRQILDYLHADAQLAASTDVIVTSDHGFATISKHDVDAGHRATASYSARQHYEDVPDGFLPPGFLAIDLAHALDLPLYDPDRISNLAHGLPAYLPIGIGAHPRAGHGLIGGSGQALDHTDAQLVVAANGGSDLIYLPNGSAALARRLAGILAALDYVGALFADDRFGALPGALPLSSIALRGHSKLPRPAFVVSFATFALPAAEAASDNPLQNAIQIADTPLQQGQGMHGSFGRDNTYNFMAAIGPDFKSHYRDSLPVSNADIVPTVLRILGWSAPTHGALTGRVLAEALTGSSMPRDQSQRCVVQSPPAPDGRRTVLEYQRYRTRLYPDQAVLGIVLQQDRTGCRKR